MINLNLNGINTNISHGSLSKSAVDSKSHNSLPTAIEIRKYVEENLVKLVNVRECWHEIDGDSNDTILVWNRVLNKLDVLERSQLNKAIHVNVAFFEVNVFLEEIPENDYEKIVDDMELLKKRIASLSEMSILEREVAVQHGLTRCHIDAKWECNVRNELENAMNQIISKTYMNM